MLNSAGIASYTPKLADAISEVLEAAGYRSQSLPPAIRAIDLAEVRRSSVDAAATDAVAHLVREALDGFWIHLDVDVLDDAIMPAVDHRMPDGLSWHELEVVLEMALTSGRAVGMELAIFNPRLDPDGTIARSLVETIAGALTR